MLGQVFLISGSLWIGWAISIGTNQKWLPKILAIPVIATIPILLFLPRFTFPASAATLLIGYGIVTIVSAHAARQKNKFAEDARGILWALAIPFGLAGLFSVISYFIPALSRSYDQAAAVLAAQATLIVALRRQLLPQEKLVGRTMVWIAYALVVGGVLLIPLTIVSWLLGAEPPLWALLGLVAVALLSAIAFPWLGSRFATLFEKVLFPDAARMKREVELLRRDLEEVRSRLRSAERLRLVGEIAAQVAHEIKNPLGPIKGYAKLLLEDAQSGKSDPASIEKGLNIIAEEAARIDERISRLLGFARERNGQRARVDLNAVCRRAVLLIEAGDELNQGGHVETELCSESAEIVADGAAVEEALYNLLLNAAQATDGAGRIRLRSRWEDSDAGGVFIIEVSDDGPGFSCDDPEELFEPFYTTKESGAGLGLGIVRNIVKTQGGAVSAIRGKQGGAIFNIRLPKKV